MVEYIPAVVAFLVAIVGVPGKEKWNASERGLRRVTWAGWLTVSFATAALVFSIFLTRRLHRQADLAKSQRARIEAIAQTELRLAIRHLTSTWFILFNEDNAESAYRLAPSNVLTPAAIQQVAAVDIRQTWEHFPPDNPCWKVISTNCKTARSEIDRALQIYSSYLDDETVLLTSELQTGDFLRRLCDMDEFVQWNEHVKTLTFPFLPFPDGNPHAFSYKSFWETIAQLDRKLALDAGAIRRRHGVPPVVP